MTAADKPRADLVALLLQFEACSPACSSMYFAGVDAGPAIAAWADLRGHVIRPATLTRLSDGKTIAWTHWTVQPADGSWTVTCSLHDDHEVTASAAQADQQVLARVQAALSPRRTGPQDYVCTACGETMTRWEDYEEYQHSGCGGLVRLKEQPQAAGGV